MSMSDEQADGVEDAESGEVEQGEIALAPPHQGRGARGQSQPQEHEADGGGGDLTSPSAIPTVRRGAETATLRVAFRR